MKDTAIKATKKAGEYLLKEFSQPSFIKRKSKHEILTKEDLIAEKIILNYLRKKFPEHSFFSEESGLKRKKSDYLWLVDPLDGTTNFSIRNPLFSSSIALVYKNEIVLGIIYVPVLKELFIAEKGKGVFLNNKKIRVSKKNKISESILTFCSGNKEEDFKKAIKIYSLFKLKTLDLRQLGSAAIELAWVASGRTEAIMIPGVNPWDAAAGALLVREASGKVTDFENKSWNLNSKDILASNKVLHNKIIKTLKTNRY